MKLLALLLLLALPVAAQQFSPEAARQDFHQLLTEMSSHYANLEWVANDRRTDLPKLRARTEERLRTAHSEEDVHVAFQKFIRALGEGHVEIQWPTPPAQPSSASQSVQSADQPAQWLDSPK